MYLTVAFTVLLLELLSTKLLVVIDEPRTDSSNVAVTSSYGTHRWLRTPCVRIQSRVGTVALIVKDQLTEAVMMLPAASFTPLIVAVYI